MRSFTMQERVMKPQECLLGRLSRLPFIKITHNDIVLLIVVFVERVNRDNSCHGTRFFTELSINSYSNQVFFLEILGKHSVLEDGFTSLLSSLALVTVKERCIWNKVEVKPFRSYRI